MDPQVFPWGSYCAGFAAIWARLLRYLKGTAERPWSGFPQKRITAFSPPPSVFAPSVGFLGDRVTGRE